MGKMRLLLVITSLALHLLMSESSHEVEVDEEIGNFDAIHKELVERKRAPYVSEPPDSEFYVPPEDNEPLPKKRSKRSNPEPPSDPGFSEGSNQHVNIYSDFEVKPNTIIRTQDSRAMGAEFLNETRKSTNNDCLHWCLENLRCNVAVFAEKNGNSCYLFDCGMPNDFRCQFTSHGHYISSTLKGPNNAYDFFQWKSQKKHENDLASLRQIPSFPTTTSTTEATENEPKKVESIIPTSEAPSPQQNVLVLKVEAVTEIPQGCKRYQFQCHHSRECIAIYNVCDGIPQCADQSDEAEDLQCPSTNDSPYNVKNALPVQTTITSKPIETVQSSPIRSDPQPKSAMHDRQSVPSDMTNRLLRPDTLQEEQKMSKLQEGGGMMKQLDSSAGGSWSSANYPVEAEMHSADMYPGANRDASHYPQQPGIHPAFSNRHSSFVAAGNQQYRPEIGSGYPIGQYGGYYHGENYDRSMGRPATDGQSQPALAHSNNDFDYNRYDNSYHKTPAHQSYDTHQNFDGRYRADPAKDSAPVDKYRPSDRIWPEEPIPRASGYPSKSDESPMVPYDAGQNAPQSGSYLSRYSEASVNRPLKMYPEPQPPPHYPGPNDESSRHISPYGEPIDLGPPHDHGAVVRAQVQNDEETEDSLYDPQAEVPISVNNLPQNRRIMPKHHQHVSLQQETSSTLSPASISIKTTIPPKPVSIRPAAVLHNTTHHASPSHIRISQSSVESGMTVAELQQSSRIHAREFNGAVLALTLGLCVTALLAVLVSCRLKNIRRRLARKGGRSSLAHDADYLVNGMYL